MLSHSLVVKLIAKPDRTEDVARFLVGALPLAESEEFTPVWFAFRSDATTFYIVDAFVSASDRDRHLNGAIAAALMSKAGELLAEPPEIEKVDVLASKVEG